MSDLLDVMAFVGALVCAGIVCAAILIGCFLLLCRNVNHVLDDIAGDE